MPVTENSLATAPNHDDAASALVVSTVTGASQVVGNVGAASYSYRYVYESFAPLLKKWCAHDEDALVEISRSESRLDFALRQAQKRGYYPLHAGFLPLESFYFSSQAPNIAFPFWDFPDVPSTNLGDNPRHNWVRIANHCDLLLTASEFTRDAFTRAGITTPIHVVPVPLPQSLLELPTWQRGQCRSLPCQAYCYPDAPIPTNVKSSQPVNNGRSNKSNRQRVAFQRTMLQLRARVQLRSRLRNAYRDVVRPRLPWQTREWLTMVASVARSTREARCEHEPLSTPISGVELSGVIFTAVFNPFDVRKNWEDLLSGFLLALRDCEDATLVLKLVLPPQRAMAGLNHVLRFYQKLHLSHACRLLVITDYLSDEQMQELISASTYIINTSRAEGGCLPLQQFLGAGRPAIAPCHTAIADYFDASMGFVVESHLEPTAWPQDPNGHCTTTWHRLVWKSLHDQIQAAYHVATEQPERYQEIADTARLRMSGYASPEVVWPRLKIALDAAIQAATTEPGETVALNP